MEPELCRADTSQEFAIVSGKGMSSIHRGREGRNRKIRSASSAYTRMFWSGRSRIVMPFLRAVTIAIALSLFGVATGAVAQQSLAPEIEAKMAAATQSLKSGDLDSAENAFSAVLREGIKHPLVYHNLGVIALLRGHHAEAVAQFRQALALQPENGSSRLLLGSSLLGLRKNVEAVRELKRATALLPNEPQAHLELGTAYEAVGNWIAAVREFQKLVKLAPQEPEFSYQLGSAWTRLSDWSFREIIKVNPNSARAHLGLGLEFAAQGKYDEALLAYQLAARSDPKMPEVHLAMAVAYLETKNFDEALSEIAQEFLLVPESKAAAEAKAKVLAAKSASPD